MQAGEHASEQSQQSIPEALAPAGDHASSQPSKQPYGQASNRAGEISSAQAIELAAVQAVGQPRLQQSLPAREQTSLHDPFEYLQGPRSAVSFRMTERLQERLREFAHRSRRTKQDIMDQAVHEFLLRAGFCTAWLWPR
jgi:hypothetical protein